MFQIIVFVGYLVAAVVTQHHDEGHHDYHAPPHYKFDYSVHDPHTHDIKKQEESRKDDKVKGFYSLKEADGTTREVHYTADHKSGFNAHVERKGEAVYPKHYKSSSETFYDKHSHDDGAAISSASYSRKH